MRRNRVLTPSPTKTRSESVAPRRSKDGLQRLGWERAQSSHRLSSASGDQQRLKTYASDWCSAPDALLAGALPALEALKRETARFRSYSCRFPIRSKLVLVANLAHPGGNVTALPRFEPLDRR